MLQRALGRSLCRPRAGILRWILQLSLSPWISGAHRGRIWAGWERGSMEGAPP